MCDPPGNAIWNVYVCKQGPGTFTGHALALNASGEWCIGPDGGRLLPTGNRPGF